MLLTHSHPHATPPTGFEDCFTVCLYTHRKALLLLLLLLLEYAIKYAALHLTKKVYAGEESPTAEQLKHAATLFMERLEGMTTLEVYKELVRVPGIAETLAGKFCQYTLPTTTWQQCMLPTIDRHALVQLNDTLFDGFDLTKEEMVFALASTATNAVGGKVTSLAKAVAQEAILFRKTVRKTYSFLPPFLPFLSRLTLTLLYVHVPLCTSTQVDLFASIKGFKGDDKDLHKECVAMLRQVPSDEAFDEFKASFARLRTRMPFASAPKDKKANKFDYDTLATKINAKGKEIAKKKKKKKVTKAKVTKGKSVADYFKVVGADVAARAAADVAATAPVDEGAHDVGDDEDDEVAMRLGADIPCVDIP